MISFTLGVEEDQTGKPTRRRAEQAIAIHAESVRNVFRALRLQLPRLKHFIDVGLELERAMAMNLRLFNQLKKPGRTKTTQVGIADPVAPEIKRILAMAEYAGILRQMGTVSRGSKGVFHKYSLHAAIVIVENSLSLGKSYALEDLVASLSQSSAHAFTRTRVSTLLGTEAVDRCTIDLAPCQKCGTERPSEDAKFCMACGAELKNVSVYEELVNASIDNLPLTQRKLDGILEHTSIRTVQDILLDEDSKEIRKVPYVGPVWSARIRNAAQEYVSV
jgi:hypothetical protein